MQIDRLDAALIRLLVETPRIGVVECSRRLAVARGTVQARLDRLRDAGVIRGFGPDVDPGALGFAVTAFATLEIRQGQGRGVQKHLEGIAQVLELHTITGRGDLLCRIVARSNSDLQRVIEQILEYDPVVRVSTTIALDNPVPYRVLPLVEGAVADG
ncbi:Lrp/AsnC family transcriptional regulator [Streptomyces sp. SID3343]|uniref:Lrp/AsnC family transcriptional regulator n=1 Tax=Streptomyces sp. SID3343 TaxID=2690260 RepID=UPI001371AAC3|nr:Lrp/AsnC family transcriptional regulator [Streptomyces sp. SID3343]MYW05378.1 AsnC family transcriptional regulator [Streptomyces sp. SID3343]